MLDNPKKVAVLFRLDSYGGVQKCVCSLVRGLNAQGIVPDLLWDEPPLQGILEEERVQLEYKPIRFTVASKYLVKLPPLVRMILKSAFPFRSSKLPDDYDFVYFFSAYFRLDQPVNHLFYLSGPPMLPQLEQPRNWLSKQILKAFKKLHQLWIKPAIPVYEYNPAIKYVINSQYTASLFEQHHQVKLKVVYPPLAQKSTQHRAAPKRWIAFFSRIVAYKNPQVMLQLAEKFPHEEFLIMGSVTYNQEDFRRSLENKIAEQNLNNIRIDANPSHHKVTEYLSQTKIYIFPAENEHFGITTVEAMQLGAIPLVHDSGGQVEIVPFEALRFSGNDLIDKLAYLLKASPHEIAQIREDLTRHLDQFKEHQYLSDMLEGAKLRNH